MSKDTNSLHRKVGGDALDLPDGESSVQLPRPIELDRYQGMRPSTDGFMNISGTRDELQDRDW